MHFLDQFTQFIVPKKKHSINYIQILKLYLQHFSVQVYHFQGAQNASFNNQLPMINYYLPGSLVCSSPVLDVD